MAACGLAFPPASASRSRDNPALDGKQIARFVVTELRGNIVDHVPGWFAQGGTLLDDGKTCCPKQAQIIVMPQPVDILFAAVERLPLLVGISQEIQARNAAVGSRKMVTVITRMRR